MIILKKENEVSEMKRKKGLIFILYTILILSFTLCGAYVHNENKKKAAITVAESIKREEKRLQKEREAQAIAAKEKSMKDKAAAKAKADAEAKVAAAVTNPTVSNYREFFKQDVFMGDSISEGLSFYEYLDENMVVAKKGASVSSAVDNVDTIAVLKPNRIFIMYGVNNMDDTTPSKWFVDQYIQLINAIRQKLPNAEIYIQSVMPVIEKIVHKNNTHINNAHINECNEALKIMAIQQGVNFLNVASILNESNKYLYEGDGTHFISKFYPLWLNYIESNVIAK